MKAIKQHTAANKFTVDAILHEGKYYLPCTINCHKVNNYKPTVSACYYDRYRGKWLEDTFYPSFQLLYQLETFATSKGLS